MLLQFKIKNHKCFYDECILDLTATQEKRHIESTIDSNGIKILPIIEINGANAAGKSSLIEALEFFCYLIKSSSKIDVNENFPCIPFAFGDKDGNQNSEYEVSLLLDGYEYRYGFAINKNGIAEEWLYAKKTASKSKQKIVFERLNNKVSFGSSYQKYKKTWELFGSDNIYTSKLLVLSTVAIKEEEGILRSIYEDLNKFYFKIDNFFVPENSIEILNSNSLLFDKFQNIIREFDPCLVGIKVDELKEENQKTYKISGIHKNIGNSKTEILIPLQRESEGTIKMFNIIPSILNNLEYGGVLCVDELDVKLHPLLFKKIVSMYKDKSINKNNAQIIYTAHSTYLFNSDNLRRDELYLVEKNNEGKSKLYSLSEFRNLRVDADYEKKYLTGEFGAIPYKKD